MKCLKTIEGKVMKSRYRDNMAAEMVATGNYQYCPKEEWKKEIRDLKLEKKK